MKTVVITGISGTLGSALGREYLKRGWRVVGVSRSEDLEGDFFSELHVNPQESIEDARSLYQYDPDLIILNAGQIEKEIGEAGLPLPEVTESMNRINYSWPALVALEAPQQKPEGRLDVIAIGSIADGSPSSFGPVYHAGKIALHYFWTGVGPIVDNATDGRVRLRLYRPGAIYGPLAWAPVNRLNRRSFKIREKRVKGAPKAERVARDIADWVDTDKWIGTWDEPFSFRLFKLLHSAMPNLYYKLNNIGWRKGSWIAAPDDDGWRPPNLTLQENFDPEPDEAQPQN